MPTYSGESLTDTARRLDPQLLPAEADIPPLTPEQLALLSLQNGRWADAVAMLSQLDAAAGSAGPAAAGAGATAAGATPIPRPEIKRLLGIALVGNKRPAEAARAMADAYGADESLTMRPVGAEFVGGAESLRSLVVQSVRNAQKAQTTNDWFVVGVLMQAQGRDRLPDKVAEGLRHHRLASKLFPTLAQPIGQSAKP